MADECKCDVNANYFFNVFGPVCFHVKLLELCSALAAVRLNIHQVAQMIIPDCSKHMGPSFSLLLLEPDMLFFSPLTYSLFTEPLSGQMVEKKIVCKKSVQTNL